MVELPGRAGSTAAVAEPFYAQIEQDIRRRIASGEWPPGSRLPSNMELRQLYRSQLRNPGLAMATVARALRTLKDAGVLRGQQGLAVFVEDPQP